MFKGKIHNRVMSAVKNKIADAQKKLDTGIDKIHEEHDHAILDLEVKRDNSIIELENTLVQEIIGKVI